MHTHETMSYSNLISCKTCGHEVGKKAPYCPNCGSPVKKSQSAIGLLAAIIIALIIAFFLGLL